MTIDDITDDDPRLSRPDSMAGRLQRALLDRLHVHEREETLPTSIRFLFYELIQAGVVSKAATGARRADQNTIEAVTHLREIGLVPWEWIVDETRSLQTITTAATVADWLADDVQYAMLDRWDGQPAPLILCESRSLAGTLRNLAAVYACPIASTNGQSRGFLISEIAPILQEGQPILYLGDFDWCGGQIEAATQATLAEHSPAGLTVFDNWQRIALTDKQVRKHKLPKISKPDHRYRPVRHYEAVETEAFGQARIVAAVRARLDQLMPEPLDNVFQRERAQRAEVTEQLRSLR
jgi:hypothetical protein